jgi:hypothetical protein
MTDNSFWVNPDGLAKSSQGFSAKATQITSLADQIGKLTAPSVIGEAAGSDAAGQQFAAAHLQQAGQLYDGLLSWAGAVDNTGQSVNSTAKMFGAAENNAGDAAGSLGQQLDSGSGSGSGSGNPDGSNGAPGVLQPRVMAAPQEVMPEVPPPGPSGSGATPGVAQPQEVISEVPAASPGDGSGSSAPGQQLDAGPGSGSGNPDGSNGTSGVLQPRVVAAPQEVMPEVPSNGVGLVQPREVIPQVPESVPEE